MIDRYLLRYFLAVIDCGNFSKAAKQLNVAQPTLSVGISKLEQRLGATLFQRTNKRVHLTEAGSRLSAHARRIENEFNLAEATVLHLKPDRVLRLGTLSTLPIACLAGAIRSSRAKRDGERLQVITGSERELLQRLTRSQIDAALTIIRPDLNHFSPEPLFTERYLLAMHSGHRLARKSIVAAEELSDETMIVRRHCEVLTETSKHFTERGVRPFLAFRGTNDEQVMALVHAGLGITVMPACYSMKGVARPLLTGFEVERTIGLLYSGQGESLKHSASPLLNRIRRRLESGTCP